MAEVLCLLGIYLQCPRCKINLDYTLMNELANKITDVCVCMNASQS